MRTLVLCLGVALVSMLACNPAADLSSAEKNQGPGGDQEQTAEPANNIIRHRVGLRSARGLNLVMQSLVGKSNEQPNTGDRQPNPAGNNQGNQDDNNADNQANNGMGNEAASASANTACRKESKCAEFTINSHGATVCARHAGFEMVGEGKVGNEFCQVSGLLPSGGGAGVNSGGVLALTGAGQVGIFKLGSAYCAQLMEEGNEGKQTRSQRLPSVAAQLNAITLSTSPADLSDALRSAVAKALVENLHGAGLAIRPDQQKMEQELTNLMTALMNTKEDNSRAATNQEVLIGACTAALASAQVTFY